MPIESSVCLRPISQEEFARLDYQVMHHAFDSQNELGRLCEEIIYRNDLAARLENAELGSVRKEVPVTVRYQDFAKTDRIDLVVGDAAIYELKTELRLVPEHEAQLLTYLFLEEAHHGKLVNFRPAQVESKSINTSLTMRERRRVEVDMRRWRAVGKACKRIAAILVDLFNDWGAFLELSLYQEALTHFLGGEANVLRLLPLKRNGVPLGNQRFHLASSETAFRLTALTGSTEHFETQLRCLLAHSPLRAIQWINFARHQVQFVTVTR